MSTEIFYPGVSGDDGYVYGVTLYLTRDYLQFGLAGQIAHAFVRFPNVTIPQGTHIDVAFIRFTCLYDGAGEPCNTNIFFNDADNAVAPNTYTAFINLVKTTAFTPWDNIEAWSSGVQYDTPSLVDEVQEVVNRSGWASGQAMMMMIYNDGSIGALSHRWPSSIDYLSGAEKAELHITWGLIQSPANYLIYRGRDRFRTKGYSEGY